MNIAFRVDSSKKIGLGHLMRCLTLAKVLSNDAIKIIFIVNDEVNEKIIKPFDVIKLPDYSTNGGQFSQEIDSQETIQVLKRLNKTFDWLIVDHYQIDSQWENAVRPYVKKIMVIDDLADRPHACEILLDQNLSENQNRYQNLVSLKTKLLLGPQYSLLREEFKKNRINMKIRDNIKQMLIFFGGGDCANETIKAIEAVKKLNRADIFLDVVVGEACPSQQEIKDMCASISNARFFCQSNQISQLMNQADLAIGAGGTITWERCCLGLPSIVLTIAENQVALTSVASSLGVINYLGKSDEVTEEALSSAIQELIKNPEMLRKMSENAHELVDGMGSQKVASSLMELING